MTRVLTLTSPHMRGDDVGQLQAAVNRRLAARGIDVHIDRDEEYGPETHDAVRQAARELGVSPVDGSTDAALRRVEVIRHPGNRTKAELDRAEKRAKAREAAGQGLEAALRWAAAQVGTGERPAGSNRGPKIDDWQKGVGIAGAPWCGAFAHAVALVYGVDLTNDVRYCPWIKGHAQAGTGGFERWTTSREVAQRALSAGHLVLVVYDFGGPIAEHVGVARSLTGTYVDDYEGNTSTQGKTGSQSDGGIVARRTDRADGLVQGYAIVRKPR